MLKTAFSCAGKRKSAGQHPDHPGRDAESCPTDEPRAAAWVHPPAVRLKKVWKKRSRCTECRQCKEKHGFPAGVQKVCRAPENGKFTRNLTILRLILVCSRELESLALWLKEPTGQNTLILEVSSLRHFCAKHRDFLPSNFCILCRILQVRVPIASLETVQKQCRNRALTLGQIKNDDFWSMTWWRFEWPQR